MARSLLEEFCADADERLDAASTALLALEDDLAAEGVLDELFRNLHTVKGASGIFPVGPFTADVHDVEEVVAAIRSGGVSICTELIDDLLGAIDRLRSAVATIRATGTVAVTDASVRAEAQRRLLRWTGRPARGADAFEVVDPDEARPWLSVLPPREVERCRAFIQRTGTCVRAVRFLAPPDAFHVGVDPVALILDVPGIDVVGAALDAGAAPETFDCALVLVALTRADPAEIAVSLAPASGSVSVAELGAGDLVAGDAGDPAGISRRVLEVQVAALARGVPDAQLASRLRAAAAAVRGALALVDGTTERLDAALQQALGARDPGPLLALLEDALSRVSFPTRPEPRAPATVAPAPPSSAPPAADPLDGVRARSDRSLRVERDTVDDLLRHTSEMVVETNAMRYLARRARLEGNADLGRELTNRAGLTRRVVDELRALVLDMRTLPVGLAFDPVPRLVRDVARRTGKQIRLERRGTDIHADADIIDLLRDAVVHLVRNAADHGIEPPEDRVAAGKPEHGTVALRAHERPDGLVVEVIDDGGGFDVEGLRRRAVDSGFAAADDVSDLSMSAAAELAFLPGLSTASEVSELSGRGVGLDAVQAAVRAAHGEVTIESSPGAGTTVRIHVPRSLSVTDALVVRTGSQSFAIPIEQVRETTRIRASDRRRLGRSDIVELHGQAVPLRSLHSLLTSRAAPEAAAPESDGNGALVVVAETDRGAVALTVDAIEGREEVLVTPLAGVVAGQRRVLGTSVRGDGSVLVVLDANEVCNAG